LSQLSAGQAESPSDQGEVRPVTRKRLTIITSLLGVVVLALLGWYLYRNREVFASLGNITPWQIVLILLTETVSILLGSLMNYSLIRRFGYHVTFRDSVLLQYINNFLNKVLPTIGGGAAFRGVYLKKKYAFPYSQFVSTLSGFYVISFVAISTIGLLCMLFFYVTYREVNWVIILAYFALLIPSLVIILFSPRLPETSNRMLRILRNVVEGWNVVKKDKRFVLFYGVIAVVQLLISAWQMLVGFQALGVSAGFTQALFICSLGIILSFLSFTPDGIGIREGVYIFSARLVQIPQSMLVLVSLLLRALSIFSTMIIGGIAYLALLHELRRIEENKSGMLKPGQAT